MIRRSVWVKTVAFVVIAVVGVSYVSVHYLGVGAALFGGRYTAYVDLPDSGGLFTTASVTYRGIEVGRVGPIRLHGAGVRVALDIDGRYRIPADSSAVVGNGSPIGEQFVDLRPPHAGGPSLHAGSVIPASRTSLPVSTQQLLVALDQLVRSVPQQDLRTTVTELGTAFDGTGPQLRQLLDSTQALLARARTDLPATVALLRDGGTVLDTQNDLAPQITSFSRDLATFTDALRGSDADLRAVLREGVPVAQQVVALENDIDATLPVVLGNLTSLGQVTAVRIPALRQILIIYPYVVATSFGLFPGNGSTRFGIPVPPAADHQPCQQGYLPASKRRLPDQLDYPPIRYGSYCQAPTSADINVRGSREAREPDGKRLGDEPSYRNNEGLPRTGGGSSTATTSSYELGSTGGQQAVMGDASWMSLLFAPMS